MKRRDGDNVSFSKDVAQSRSMDATVCVGLCASACVCNECAMWNRDNCIYMRMTKHSHTSHTPARLCDGSWQREDASVRANTHVQLFSAQCRAGLGSRAASTCTNQPRHTHASHSPSCSMAIVTPGAAPCGTSSGSRGLMHACDGVMKSSSPVSRTMDDMATLRPQHSLLSLSINSRNIHEPSGEFRATNTSSD
jgi:hypothetical protein